MGNKWVSFYTSELSMYPSLEEYFAAKITYKLPLLKIVLNLAGYESITEFGCGSGLSCVYLSKRHMDITGIDINNGMLDLAREFNSKLGGKAVFKQSDLQTWNPNHNQGVIFNNGVMEHFSDENIIAITNRVLEISNYFVFGIPTPLFKPEQAINGDERFLYIEKWTEILSHSSANILNKIGYDFNNTHENKLLAKSDWNKYQFVAFVLAKK